MNGAPPPHRGTVNKRYTFDFSPFGLDNRTPLASSIPGTISPGGTISNDNTNYPAANGNNCLNCYAIPAGAGRAFNPINNGLGPTAPFSGSTLNWTTFSVAANHNPGAGAGAVDLAGTRNEFNPYSIVDYSAGLQFTGGAVTVDQRLTKNISFYGEGLYGMRRAQVLNQENNNQLNSIGVPTWNPYYPTGGAPTNLRVAYHMSIESPSRSSAYELSTRYLGGLNIDLPHAWAAQVYYSETRDANALNLIGRVSKAAVSAALGWTLLATPASGTKPGIASFVKPATVPYLNLFCDPRTIQCNSPTTLGYINFYSQSAEAFWVNEKAVKADGPLFDLPAGAVKGAVGASYISNHYVLTQLTQSQTSTLVDVPYRSAIAISLGGVRAVERPRLQRHECDPADQKTGPRSVLAPRPVQRFRRHQQCEGRLQLDPDRRPDLQGWLGHLVPRPELRRELVALQLRMERLWAARGRLLQ